MIVLMAIQFVFPNTRAWPNVGLDLGASIDLGRILTQFYAFQQQRIRLGVGPGASLPKYALALTSSRIPSQDSSLLLKH